MSGPVSTFSRLRLGVKFYRRFALRFSRLGFEREGLDGQLVAADFRDRTWLVSGASGGIGREIAAQAAGAGAVVLAAARTAKRLENLADDIAPPGRVVPLVADLGRRSEIGRAVEQVAARASQVDVLVNNVGVLLNTLSITDEGFEESFAVNLLGHYVLTESLLARGLLGPGSVVINMSSGGMYSTPLLPDELNVTDPARHDGVMAYARHKRAQVELTHHWNSRYGPDVTFHVMHPGWVDTEGVKRSLPGFRRIFRRILRTEEQGADTAIWLAAEGLPAAPEGIWLDRELWPEHVDDATRTDPHVRTELVTALERWSRER